MGFRYGPLACSAALAVVPLMASRAADIVLEPPSHRTAGIRAETPAETGHQTGDASYYAHRFSGRKTASGQRYDPQALTAAHRTLPMGTRLRVTNPKNDRSVVVTINDRGRLPKNRVVDVSSAAADVLGMKKSGVTKVETRIERPEPAVERGAVAAPSPEADPASDAQR